MRVLRTERVSGLQGRAKYRLQCRKHTRSTSNIVGFEKYYANFQADAGRHLI